MPQVRHPSFEYQLLLCSLEDMKRTHIGWEDPVRHHNFYNLITDVEYLTDENTVHPILSVVKQYPPGFDTIEEGHESMGMSVTEFAEKIINVGGANQEKN